MSSKSRINRKRYQRRLDVGSIVSLLVLGAICAGAACGFVRIKNAHVERTDAKYALEQEIRVFEKEMNSIAARISSSIDRSSLAEALALQGTYLVPIESNESYSPSGSSIPIGIAAAALPGDGDITYINVENPSG